MNLWYNHIEKGGEAMAKTTTSTEVKRRWNEKTYRRYQAYFRYGEDHEIIDFLEDNKETIGTSQIFREALEMYINANK